jgi:hypothetical protein
MLSVRYLYCGLVILAILSCGSVYAQSNSTVPKNIQKINQEPSIGGKEQPKRNETKNEFSKPPPIQNIARLQDQETKSNIRQSLHWYEIFSNHPTEWLLVIFNGLLALFTFKLVRFNRHYLIVTHRPKLRVRNIVHRQPRPVHTQQPQLFASGHFVGGQFYVVNVGGTAAKIIDSYCLVHWKIGGLPMERPYEGQAPIPTGLSGITLQPGETVPGIFQSERPMGSEGDNIRLCTDGWHIYVMGWIEYIDGIKVRRRTAFCREYQIKQRTSEGRFYPVDDPDYEHEE